MLHQLPLRRHPSHGTLFGDGPGALRAHHLLDREAEVAQVLVEAHILVRRDRRLKRLAAPHRRRFRQTRTLGPCAQPRVAVSSLVHLALGMQLGLVGLALRRRQAQALRHCCIAAMDFADRLVHLLHTLCAQLRTVGHPLWAFPVFCPCALCVPPLFNLLSPLLGSLTLFVLGLQLALARRARKQVALIRHLQRCARAPHRLFHHVPVAIPTVGDRVLGGPQAQTSRHLLPPPVYVCERKSLVGEARGAHVWRGGHVFLAVVARGLRSPHCPHNLGLAQLNKRIDQRLLFTFT